MTDHIRLHFYGAQDAPAGYNQRADVGPRTTEDGVPLATLWDEFNTRLGIFNRVNLSVVAEFASVTTKVTERVAIPRRARMEQASEYGRPTFVRTEKVARGYPLDRFDIGYGATVEFLDDATAEDVRGNITVIEDAYSRKLRQEVYKALFLSANYTDKDGVSVKKLYNADGEVPPEYESYTHLSTHTHYLYSASTAFAVGDVTAMETHLIHHGYGDDLPGGAGGQLWLRAGRAATAQIRGFTGFIPAESASVTAELANSGVLVGGTRPAAPGIQGYLGRFAIIEDLTIPAKYLLGYASGGALSTQNPVKLREHTNPSARGLRLHPGRNDYPLIESYYDTYVGAGIAHRGAAVVMYEDTGAGSAYVDPTIN